MTKLTEVCLHQRQSAEWRRGVDWVKEGEAVRCKANCVYLRVYNDTFVVFYPPSYGLMTGVSVCSARSLRKGTYRPVEPGSSITLRFERKRS